MSVTCGEGMTRQVTWLDVARINAVRWGLLGTGFGLAATAVGWWRERLHRRWSQRGATGV